MSACHNIHIIIFPHADDYTGFPPSLSFYSHARRRFVSFCHPRVGGDPEHNPGGLDSRFHGNDRESMNSCKAMGMTKEKFHFLLLFSSLHSFNVRYIIDINLERFFRIGIKDTYKERKVIKDNKKTPQQNIKDKMDDNKNKNKKIEEQTTYKNLNLRSLSVFENDTQIVFVFKKTEKIVSAIYLLTSFLLDSEPIKWKMRNDATSLLSYSLSLSHQGHRNRTEAMSNFISIALETISLLEVAKISGIVSSMNYEILRFEIEKTIDLIDLKERSLNSQFLLSKSFFETDDGHSPTQDKANASIADSDKRHSNGQVFLKDKNNESKANTAFNKGHTIANKNDRYEAIINLLKKTKEISVKDVSVVVSGCSEKTLQRELLGLVEKGVLKKEGERRWSRYSLA